MKPFSIKAQHGHGNSREWRIVDLTVARDAAEAEQITARRRQDKRYPFVPGDAEFRVEPMTSVEHASLVRYLRALRTPGRPPRTEDETARFISDRALIVQSWCVARYVNPALIDQTSPAHSPLEENDEGARERAPSGSGGREISAVQDDPMSALEKEHGLDTDRDEEVRGTDFNELF